MKPKIIMRGGRWEAHHPTEPGIALAALATVAYWELFWQAGDFCTTQNMRRPRA